MDCDYSIPIDLAPVGTAFAVKSIGKLCLQYKFGLIEQDPELQLCAVRVLGKIRGKASEGFITQRQK